MNELIAHLPHYGHSAQLIGLAVLAAVITTLAVALSRRRR